MIGVGFTCFGDVGWVECWAWRGRGFFIHNIGGT